MITSRGVCYPAPGADGRISLLCFECKFPHGSPQEERVKRRIGRPPRKIDHVVVNDKKKLVEEKRL